VKVVDVTRIVSGPLACQFLAALGADVIRVEPPGGDHTWRTPPFVGPNGVHPGPPGPDDIPLAPLRRSRGKRSVVLDLKSARGVELFLDLVAWADVLVDNFRPGAMDGLGLPRDVLTARNAGIYSIGVTYGFAPHTLEAAPPDVVVHQPRQWAEVLNAAPYHQRSSGDRAP